MILNGLDICAGSGIGSATFEALGLCKTVCYVEINDYCQRLLQQRMADGWINDAPIWDDLRTFDGREWAGKVDFMFGGIPCQPWSVAGKRAGSSDERDLWADYHRVLCEIRPRFALVENVPGLLSGDDGKQFGRILGDLAEVGFDAEWKIVSAGELGAEHVRKRLWILAYSKGIGRGFLRFGVQKSGKREVEFAGCDNATYWTQTPKPAILGMDDGLSGWLDRLAVAGNGWVPQVAAVIAGRIKQLL